MKRFYVVFHDGAIHCICANESERRIREKYTVLAKVNKLFNIHNISVCFEYFQRNTHYYLLDVLMGDVR